MNLEDIRSYKEANVNKPDRKIAYKESAKAEHAHHTRRTSPYTISIPMQVRIAMLRRIHIIRGNYTAQALSTMTFVLQAIIIGTTFVHTPDSTTTYFSRGGVLFFSVFAPAFFSMAEIPALFAQQPTATRRHQCITQW